MGKRLTKKETEALGILAVFGLIIGAIIKFFQTVGYIIPIVIVVIGVALFIYLKNKKKKERIASLTQKYGDPFIVEKIMAETVWIGQTAEQLTDALGSPPGTDQKILKTKKKEIWKYGHQGGNRYTLRITLDDDIVIGWDDKR